MQTLVKHAGVIDADSMEELVDITQILVRCRELPSGGAAIFTESGAFKALALDLCDRVGMELPTLSTRAREALTEALPAFIPPSNPLDLTAQGLWIQTYTGAHCHRFSIKSVSAACCWESSSLIRRRHS